MTIKNILNALKSASEFCVSQIYLITNLIFFLSHSQILNSFRFFHLFILLCCLKLFVWQVVYCQLLMRDEDKIQNIIQVGRFKIFDIIYLKIKQDILWNYGLSF